MSDDTLAGLRRQIDETDARLIPLLCERMDTALKIAQYKKENGLPVFDPSREDAVLQKLAAAGDYKDYAVVLYQIMMDFSRMLQYDAIFPGGAGFDGSAAEFDGSLPCRVACFGKEGAYAHIAAGKIFAQPEITFFSTFGETAAALLDGSRFDYAVLPVENSTAGSVSEVYDILINNPLYIAAGLELPISHCLLGCEGASAAIIKEVYSHKQALSQCSEFIKANGFRAEEELSTAAAALKVSALGSVSCGAIASEKAAEKYGLKIIEKNIQNASGNSTRFIALSRTLCSSRGADKISIVFTLDHSPGTLYRTLARFAALGLNLTKIESRPRPGSGFEYIFYLDFSGNISKSETRRLLSALSSELQGFKLLGNYRDSHL